MTYAKTTWVDGGLPAIDAANLNNMENGIAAAITDMVTARQTQTVDAVSTNALVTLANLTLPAAGMGSNGIVVVRAWGDYLNTTGSNQGIAIATDFGGGTGLSVGQTVGSSASRGSWVCEWRVCNQNATNVQQQHLWVMIGGNHNHLTSAMAVDTTASVAVKIQTTPQVSSAVLSIRLHCASMQVFGA